MHGVVRAHGEPFPQPCHGALSAERNHGDVSLLGLRKADRLLDGIEVVLVDLESQLVRPQCPFRIEFEARLGIHDGLHADRNTHDNNS